MDIFLRGLPSGRNYLIKYGVDSGRPIDDNKIEWTPKSPYDKDTKFTILVCRSGTGTCTESQTPFSIVSDKAPDVTPATPIIEPDTPEYNRLRDIVNNVDTIVSKDLTPVSNSITPESSTPATISTTNFASPKQSGYLPYNFDTRLSLGMTDSDAVRALQEALTREGLFNHAITGRFFEITENAVKAFQTKYGLDPSGSTGPGTQKKLNELYNVIEVPVAPVQNASQPID
jgi:hypothetical protein